MNWASQVSHVSAKDIRRVRWPLTVSLALIAFSTAMTVTHQEWGFLGNGAASDLYSTFPVLLVVLGIFITAFAVQQDSPMRVEAFWSTKPLSSRAVFASKAATVLGVVLLPALIGAFITLRSLDVGPGEIARLLSGSAVRFGLWLLIAMILAALTDNIAGFIAWFLGVVVGLVAILLIASYLLRNTHQPTGGEIPLWFTRTLLPSVLGAASILLLVFLYRRPEIRWPARVAGVALAAWLIAFSFLPPSLYAGPPNGPSLTGAPSLAMTAGPMVKSDSSPAADRFILSIRADPDAAPDRLRVTGMSIRATAEGSGARGFASDRLVTLGPDFPPVGDDKSIRWFQVVNPRRSNGFSLFRRDLARNVAFDNLSSVTVVGGVTRFRAHLVADLPLRIGAEAAKSGRRVRVADVGGSAATTWIVVQTSTITTDSQSGWLPADDGSMMFVNDSRFSDLQFALVNAARGEGLLLKSDMKRSRSGSAVVPWIDILGSLLTLTTEDVASPPTDPDWYANAKLVVVEWLPVSRHRVEVSATIPR